MSLIPFAPFSTGLRQIFNPCTKVNVYVDHDLLRWRDWIRAYRATAEFFDRRLVVSANGNRPAAGEAGEARRFGLAASMRLLCCFRMPAERNRPKRDCFNPNPNLPFQLRLEDFEIAMQDVYDLFHDVNTGLLEKGLERLDDFVRPAIMSGLLSDLLTASIAKHSRALTQNKYFNGHPDLLVKGVYPNDSVRPGMKALRSRQHEKAEAQSIHTALETSGWRFSFTTSTTD